MKPCNCLTVLAGISIAWLATSAQAQWSSDPANNLLVANGPGDQVQPKLVATPDGGAYVSWYDNGVPHYKSDTWTWSGTAWTRAFVSGPAARYRHAMAYDSARQRTVLFGGADATTSYSDTWEWDGAAWTQRSVSGPAGRQGLAMAFDTVHNQVVMFGGQNASGLLGDTWTFDGNAWTQQSPVSSPSARQGHALAWDSTRGIVVLFGGADAGGAQGDTWEWNGTTWNQVSTGLAPSARQGHSMAFDPVTSQVLLFGGLDASSTVLQDTWTYGASGWTSVTTATLPTARYNSAMANDNTASGVRTVVFGGFSGSFNVGNLYEFSGTNWASKTTTPNTRNGPAMAFHAANNTTVMFGGMDTGGYDVFLQKLNAAGVKQWPNNGVEIADRAQSSTVDYSLATDHAGNAVIVFNDDRFATGKITLQKVSPSGTLLFNGTLGLQVGDGATNASPPTVAVLADGNYGVIWNSTASPVTTMRQKVDSTTGALMWGAGIAQTDWLSPARPVQASDVQADDAGGMIVLYVRCTGTNCVTSNKQLFAQKYDATGAAVWGSGVPLTVFAGTGSIQTGTFPRFLSDGSGGAIFGWYENSASRNSYMQHILSSGSFKFANPVASTGTTAGRMRILQNIAYNRLTGDYFLAFEECDISPQQNYAMNVQRITTEGSLMWGNDGVQLHGPDGFYSVIGNPEVQAAGDGCTVMWTWEDNTNRGYIYAAHVAADASVSWNQQIDTIFQTYTNRMGSARSTQGFCMFVDGAGTGGSQDIVGIRINDDGSLGNPVSHCGTADFNCDGDIGTDSDIAGFFACLSGSCPAAPCTNGADFNGDGDIGTDSDIEAFFRVLSGGSC